MKKWKKVLGSLLVSGGILTVSLSAPVWANASDNYVRMADNRLNEYMFTHGADYFELFDDEDGEAKEQEMERLEAIFDQYSVFPDYFAEALRNPTIRGAEANEDTRTLAGLENFVNMEEFYLEGGTIVDLRPLAQLTELKDIFLSSSNSIPNLNSLKELTKLERLDISFSYQPKYSDPLAELTSGTQALTDISALSELPNLSFIRINTSGYLSPITLRQGYRKYEVLDPIILSSQFEGAAVQYTSDEENFTNDNGLLKWSAIPFETEALTLNWSVVKGDFEYHGYTEIPIVWK